MEERDMIGNWKAVLFDLDGTLIDSEWFYYKAWRKALEHYGFALGSDMWLHELAGKTDSQALEYLHSNYGFTVDKAAFNDRTRAIIAELHEVETVSLMPGATDLINFLHQRELIMAVVTSSKREVANYHLERNDLRHFFSTVVSRTDVHQPKPNPEPYLRCVAQLGLEHEDCLVMEDSVTGATAAKAAGLTCFGVQTHLSIRQELPTDRSFDNLHEVREFLESLIAD
ncbi:HAD family hydrolase [Parapedobacter sp. 10938]|uniref:HAD family hydrolase n=1 Tax=Parapedobacter flavus TaxID=3110225 RepID=UPI002DBB5410|nr:HAD family phosphatase [Parapedobacter sp. 10938]MEC3880390.1 HAD family phosphatase [Parapedobacter sp. 10938]